MKRNSGADNDGVKIRAFRRFGCGQCPEIPHSCWRKRVSKRRTGFATPSVNSPAALTLNFPYHGDKLSRLAPPSELNEHPSSCGIRS